jgi:hypothetical protein
MKWVNIMSWSSIAISVFLPILVHIQLIFGVSNNVSIFHKRAQVFSYLNTILVLGSFTLLLHPKKYSLALQSVREYLHLATRFKQTLRS